MTVCSMGEASRIEARPSPTSSSITGKPTVTPARWGRLRARPKRAPEEASITLLGPGVNAMTDAKTRTASAVWSGMDAKLGQSRAFEPRPTVHDGYSGGLPKVRSFGADHALK